MKKLLTVLVVGGLLGACADESSEMSFRCENMEGPDIMIRTRQFNGSMHININDRFETVLTRDFESSPGARYENGEGIEFWIQGNRAYYTSFGAGVACVRE